jgi:glutaredoxin
VTRSRRSRWRNSALLAALGLFGAASLALEGNLLVAAVALVIVAPLAWLVSPLRPDRSVSHWEAQERHVRDGDVIIYWRPGCPFCLQLRLALGRHADEALWVDIWADDEAAAFVRDVNHGSETVPTVIFRNGEARSNPRPELVAAELAA